MREYAGQTFKWLGYAHLFHVQGEQKSQADTTPLQQINALALNKSIRSLNSDDEVTSIMVNYPALLLRKKSQLYPDGRTSYRFKRELRKQVTIIGKSAVNAAVKALEEEEKKKVLRFTEADQKETDDKDDDMD